MRFFASISLLVSVLSTATALASSPADEFKKTQQDVKRCVADGHSTAIIVFACGFNLSSTGDLVSGVPDIWKVNDDCTVKDQPRLVYVNPLKPGAFKKMTETVGRLVKEDQTRPVILIGHSMGGAALEDMTKSLWEKSLRADLLIAIDAVAATTAIPLPKLGNEAKESLGTHPEVSLSGAPYAAVHIRADGTGPNTSGDSLQRVFIPTAVQYEIRGTNHTTVDGAPQTLALVTYLSSLVPQKGINSIPNATPVDYRPMVPPRDLSQFPGHVRTQLGDSVIIVK